MSKRPSISSFQLEMGGHFNAVIVSPSNNVVYCFCSMRGAFFTSCVVDKVISPDKLGMPAQSRPA